MSMYDKHGTKEIEKAMMKLLEVAGIEKFSDYKKLDACLEDYVPSLELERRMIHRLGKAGVLDLMYKGIGCDEEGKKYIEENARNKMCDEEGMKEEVFQEYFYAIKTVMWIEKANHCSDMKEKTKGTGIISGTKGVVQSLGEKKESRNISVTQDNIRIQTKTEEKTNALTAEKDRQNKVKIPAWLLAMQVVQMIILIVVCYYDFKENASDFAAPYFGYGLVAFVHTVFILPCESTLFKRAKLRNRVLTLIGTETCILMISLLVPIFAYAILFFGMFPPGMVFAWAVFEDNL